MPWNAQLTSLRDVLAQIYPDIDDARFIASTALLPMTHIALQGRPLNVWHAILEEAEKQGQVEAVLFVALAEYPNNEHLRAAAKAYGISVEMDARAQPSGGRPGPMQGGARPAADKPSTQFLTDLRKGIVSSFGMADLQVLCTDLGMLYENVPGETIESKALGLVEYMQHRGRLGELLQYCVAERPNYPWPQEEGGPQSPPLKRRTPASARQAPAPSGPPSTAQPQDHAAGPKTVILFLASDPTDGARLRLGEEAREIQQRLQLSQGRERFDFQTRWSVRAADVIQALLDAQPQVVHFSGHGEETRGPGDAEQGDRALKLMPAAGAPAAPGGGQDGGAQEGGGIYLEDELGEAQLAPAAALAALFEQFTDSVQCVVLNACYSEGQARAIARHIPYVVGMRRAIGDRAAIAFSTGFYMGLGAGRSVESAYKLGCAQIGMLNIPEHLTPVLIVKE